MASNRNSYGLKFDATTGANDESFSPWASTLLNLLAVLRANR